MGRIRWDRGGMSRVLGSQKRIRTTSYLITVYVCLKTRTQGPERKDVCGFFGPCFFSRRIMAFAAHVTTGSSSPWGVDTSVCGVLVTTTHDFCTLPNVLQTPTGMIYARE